MSSVLDRFEKRVANMEAKIEAVRGLIKSGRMGGEPDRQWLDTFCKGVGLDICCGDLKASDDAIGIDKFNEVFGVNIVSNGDRLTFSSGNECDYIVCNYFDCFDSPIATLNEWKRVLKPGGKLAFICCNLDKYPSGVGPLQNRNRHSLFTPRIISIYLERCGFENIAISHSEKMMRISAVKPLN